MVTQFDPFHKMNFHSIAIRSRERVLSGLLFIARSIRDADGEGPSKIYASFLAVFIAGAIGWSENVGWGQTPTPTLYGMPGMTQAPDIRWIEGLIGEGFARLALEVCESRLKLFPPDSDPYAQWLMLAMQSRTALELDRFDFSGDPNRLEAIPPQWQALVEGMKGMPREPWIRWKGIWCRWNMQQRGLASYLAAPAREPLKEWVVGSIRLSLDALEVLEQDLRKLPIASGKTISNAQKLDLQGRLALLQADLLYQRSQCYPSGSDDRLAAASEMRQSLDQALSKLPADWVGRPSLEIARVSSLIQLQQYEDAIASANQLWEEMHSARETRTASAQENVALAVVGARIARFTNRPEEFHLWIARGGGPMASPELALEQFASDLEWGGEQAAEKALAWKRSVGIQFGPYWEQRMDAILVSNHASAQRPSIVPSLEILRIEIRQLLAAKRWDDAIEKLRQAEFAASQLSSEGEAFAFGMQVAAAFENQGQKDRAAREFFETALRYPSQSRAASASLMGAWMIRPSSDPSAAPTGEEGNLYRNRLRETAARWPASDAAKQAVDWYERDNLSRDAIQPVLELWSERCGATQQISSATGRYLLGFCLRNDAWLEPASPLHGELASASSSLRDSLVETYREGDRGHFRAWIDTTQSDLRWTIPAWQGESSTWMGSVGRLSSSRIEVSLASDDLAQALSPWEEDPLGRLGILWFACESRAFAILARPGESTAYERRVFSQLQQLLKKEMGGEDRYPLGPRLDRGIQRSIRFYEMLEEGSSGGGTRILEQLERERESSKRSAWWLYRGARILQSLEVHRKEAIPWYRLMASGFPAGSEPWLEARARTAQTLRWLNDTAAADQLGALVIATYPGAEATWRIRFESK